MASAPKRTINRSPDDVCVSKRYDNLEFLDAFLFPHLFDDEYLETLKKKLEGTFVEEDVIQELRKRSIERRRGEVFTKKQAAVIMWSTVVIAFFTAYPTLKGWVADVYNIRCEFLECDANSVIAKERLETGEAIHE